MADAISTADSILLSTKKSLGLPEEVEDFDPDIIMCINSALNVLTQLGVGPVKGVSISSKEDTWDLLIGDDPRLNMAKSLVYLRTKVAFDPPTGNAILESYREQIREYECRLSYQVDPGYAFDEEEEVDQNASETRL